jgi:hypothetical protein
MPFGRGKPHETGRRGTGKRRKGRTGSRRDPFAHLQKERERAESGQPWFQAPDDAPEIELEAGISSNLTEDDLTDNEK